MYKKKEEKELFTKLAPNIHSIKSIFEKNGLRGGKIEAQIIDCINNEIRVINNDVDEDCDRLSNGKYNNYLSNLEDEDIEANIEKSIQSMLVKINRFKKEYLEKV